MARDPLFDALGRPEIQRVADRLHGFLRPSTGEPDDFAASRVQWLVHMRWAATTLIALSVLTSWAGLYPGLNRPVLAAVALTTTTFNVLVSRRKKHLPRAGVSHALVDMLLLAVVLWASGGVHVPFLMNFIFHVAIVGILGGPRLTVVAAATALGLCALLAVTEQVPALRIATWDPVPPWDSVAEVTAFAGVLAAVAYLVSHAVRELRDRELALARVGDAVALEYAVLSNTLSELDAGLEVVDADGTVMWRNKRALEIVPSLSSGGSESPDAGGAWHCHGELRPCQRTVTGECPVHAALERGEQGRCRFAATVDAQERVYEMLVFPLHPDASSSPRSKAGAAPGNRAMNLYLDRTTSVMEERGLILAERLASLGRVTQGVAHELNTPLATIRTLAADMRAALKDLAAESDAERRARLVADVAESAGIVQDETRRLGRITQGLLTGGDVVRTEIEGEVPIAAVVERARALVFAGLRHAPPVDLGPELDRLAVIADRDRLVQVMVNLLQNAYDAVRDRKEGRVSIGAHLDDGRVRIEIDDEGVGIPEAIRPRLFEPFSTSKPPGQGTGLGLYTSYMLVSAMQGTLALEPREGGGTRAIVTLPASARRALSERPPSAPSEIPGRRELASLR